MKWAWYNEICPKAAAWLRELIKAGLIMDGEVDERSISDICPDDVRGFVRCHWFAGIGVWDYALTEAGWPDDEPVWTGSCPCQPFSVAGKGEGFDDERHLWPDFHWHIQQCRPVAVFGEQVAGKDGLAWLDLVQTDLEASGYRTGASVIPACGFGAPHIRQRLYWAADSQGSDRRLSICERGSLEDSVKPVGRGSSDIVAKPQRIRRGRGSVQYAEGDKRGVKPEAQTQGRGALSPTNGFWSDAEWVYCTDGKWRPHGPEPGSEPLAARTTSSVVRLRGYGNAINSQTAKAFIESYLECRS